MCFYNTLFLGVPEVDHKESTSRKVWGCTAASENVWRIFFNLFQLIIITIYLDPYFKHCASCFANIHLTLTKTMQCRHYLYFTDEEPSSEWLLATHNGLHDCEPTQQPLLCNWSLIRLSSNIKLSVVYNKEYCMYTMPDSCWGLTENNKIL